MRMSTIAVASAVANLLSALSRRIRLPLFQLQFSVPARPFTA